MKVVLELLENRLLWLMVPFLCSGLYCTLKFKCLISKTLKVSFLKVLNFRCQVVGEVCSGGLQSRPNDRCEYSIHLGELMYDLLVKWGNTLTLTVLQMDGWCVVSNWMVVSILSVCVDPLKMFWEGAVLALVPLCGDLRLNIV